MELYYAPPASVAGDSLVIEGEEAAHMAAVMRHRPGDAILVTDGAGTLFDAVIEAVGKRSVSCSVRGRRPGAGEPRRRVVLAPALLRNPSRFDTLVEKAVELGVAAVQPLLTERTVPRHGRRERWEKIALSAMKQSLRATLPPVEPPVPLAEFLAVWRGKGVVKLLAHEAGTRVDLRGAAGGPESAVVLAIGPEGGFSPREVEEAEAAGFLPVGLGPRRLRSETAAVASLAILTLP